MLRCWRNSVAPPFVHAFHTFTLPAPLRRASPPQTSCVERRQWDASWPDDHGGASSAAAGQAQGAPRLLAVNCSLQHQPSRARPRLLTQDPSQHSTGRLGPRALPSIDCRRSASGAGATSPFRRSALGPPFQLLPRVLSWSAPLRRRPIVMASAAPLTVLTFAPAAAARSPSCVPTSAARSPRHPPR